METYKVMSDSGDLIQIFMSLLGEALSTTQMTNNDSKMIDWLLIVIDELLPNRSKLILDFQQFTRSDRELNKASFRSYFQSCLEFVHVFRNRSKTSMAYPLRIGLAPY